MRVALLFRQILAILHDIGLVWIEWIRPFKVRAAGGHFLSVKRLCRP